MNANEITVHQIPNDIEKDKFARKYKKNHQNIECLINETMKCYLITSRNKNHQPCR